MATICSEVKLVSFSLFMAHCFRFFPCKTSEVKLAPNFKTSLSTVLALHKCFALDMRRSDDDAF